MKAIEEVTFGYNNEVNCGDCPINIAADVKYCVDWMLVNNGQCPQEASYHKACEFAKGLKK